MKRDIDRLDDGMCIEIGALSKLAAVEHEQGRGNETVCTDLIYTYFVVLKYM